MLLNTGFGLGEEFVFTTMYSPSADGANVVRLTEAEGYDGGAFFSHDGSKLVFRATVFSPEAEAEERIDEAVTEDVDQMAFNTALARMMEFTNFFLKEKVRPKAAMEQLILMLSPYAPHMAEELWEMYGNDNSLAYQAWPESNPDYLKEDEHHSKIQYFFVTVRQ